jgi:hypothetical protein
VASSTAETSRSTRGSSVSRSKCRTELVDPNGTPHRLDDLIGLIHQPAGGSAPTRMTTFIVSAGRSAT